MLRHIILLHQSSIRNMAIPSGTRQKGSFLIFIVINIKLQQQPYKKTIQIIII